MTFTKLCLQNYQIKTFKITFSSICHVYAVISSIHIIYLQIVVVNYISISEAH